MQIKKTTVNGENTVIAGKYYAKSIDQLMTIRTSENSKQITIAYTLLGNESGGYLLDIETEGERFIVKMIIKKNKRTKRTYGEEKIHTPAPSASLTKCFK